MCPLPPPQRGASPRVRRVRPYEWQPIDVDDRVSRLAPRSCWPARLPYAWILAPARPGAGTSGSHPDARLKIRLVQALVAAVFLAAAAGYVRSRTLGPRPLRRPAPPAVLVDGDPCPRSAPPSPSRCELDLCVELRAPRPWTTRHPRPARGFQSGGSEYVGRYGARGHRSGGDPPAMSPDSRRRPGRLLRSARARAWRSRRGRSRGTAAMPASPSSVPITIPENKFPTEAVYGPTPAAELPLPSPCGGTFLGVAAGSPLPRFLRHRLRGRRLKQSHAECDPRRLRAIRGQ